MKVEINKKTHNKLKKMKKDMKKEFPELKITLGDLVEVALEDWK